MTHCVTARVSVNSPIHCIKFSLLLVLFKLKGQFSEEKKTFVEIQPLKVSWVS